MASRLRPILCDVGPRDGLQNEAVTVPPAVRAELCRRLRATGLARVEAGSFVSPRAVPQMADAEAVFDALERAADVRYSGLALNERGLDRALAAGVDEVHISYALTDSFGRRNQNAGVEEGAAVAATIVRRAKERELPVAVTLGVAFGCPYEGDVDPGLVIEHVARQADAGADEILLADTIGVGVPAQVRRLVPAALEAAPGRVVGLHLHDTRNTGIANADAGLECGATAFDSSVGGLGGCPFAPRATGNIATEDLVFLLERSGIDTGVDLDGLIVVAEWLAGILGHDLPGRVLHAGRFLPIGADR